MNEPPPPPPEDDDIIASETIRWPKLAYAGGKKHFELQKQKQKPRVWDTQHKFRSYYGMATGPFGLKV